MRVPIITRSSILPYLLILYAIAVNSIANSISCAKDHYGAPRSSDCDELLDIIADANDDRPRIFDEEQLRSPGGLNFPGVKNTLSTQVVQVPAYWSLRTCNMAIMSYADPTLTYVSFGVSSWKKVHTRGEDLINRCLFMGQAEGGSTVVESYYTSNPILSLIMWESGSYFDSLCNEIQNDPTSLSPSAALSLIALASTNNGTVTLNASKPANLTSS